VNNRYVEVTSKSGPEVEVSSVNCTNPLNSGLWPFLGREEQAQRGR
jgi:hypothetical protein